MQGPQNSTQTAAPKNRGSALRRHLCAFALALAAGSGLLLAACGSSDSIATLDSGRIERAIAQSSWAQRGQRAQVSCPSAIPQMKGLTFSCTAVVGSVSTRFVVVEQDDSGHVRYEARGR
jgi:hypothetical protein